MIPLWPVIVLMSTTVLAAQSGMVFELDPDLVRALELTPSQVAAILNNDREFNSTIGPRREQRRALEAALAAEEAKPSPSAAVMGEIETEIERLRRDGLARRNAALSRNRGILTLAQLERLEPKPSAHGADSDLWREGYDSGLVPITRDTVITAYGYAADKFVTAAIQFYLGLSERQVGALNAISVEEKIPLIRRVTAITQAQEDLVRTKLQTTLDSRVLGALRMRLLDALRDLENAEQAAHARRLSLLSADQVKKVSALLSESPVKRSFLSAAACEGLIARQPPQLVLGYATTAVYWNFSEAIECYGSEPLDLPRAAVASGASGIP